MKLGDWMVFNDVSQSEMARVVGTTEATISRIRRERNAPGIDIGIRIVNVSSASTLRRYAYPWNKVTKEDLNI
jgi:DNA-binding XRE family transcriptional regulator